MAPTSKSYDASPEPERFQRLRRVAHTSSERAASPSEASSCDEPGGVRLDQLSIAGSPQAKYTPPHARHGYGSYLTQSGHRNMTESPTYLVATNERDDVFTSPVKNLKERRSERSLALANMQRLDVARANNDADAQVTLRHQTSGNLSGRHQINGIDAQNLYPPTACVFVANLPEPKDDVALEAAIYREFMKYGKCWVKIRRDSHHMPFAFVQYTSDEEAMEALEKGKGAMIHGRPCRTEMVKANRTFIIQKKNCSPITLEEAEKVLLPFGSMNKCEVLHPQLRDPLGFPPTVLVEFSMFDATRDLHTAFRSDSTYTVTAFDLKKNCAATRNTSDEAFLAACERDRRSVFVGDLPPSASQEDLEDIFSEAGEILKLNLIQRPVHANNGSFSQPTVRTMAFIEYSQPDMPEVAIAKLHGKPYKGAAMRVERKSVKDRGPTPRHSRSQLQLAHRPSDENFNPAARGITQSTPRTVITSGQPSSPTVVSTPRHSNLHAPVEMSPAPMGPSMYNWGYGANSPYNNVNYTYGAAAAAAAAAGGSGMPMTPQGTPQMPSPWSYYQACWPNMMAAYDPSFYMTPYAIQSPTPATGGGSAAAGSRAAPDDQGEAHPTPTRGGGGGGVPIKEEDKGDEA